jgi:hypothetical protein
MSEATGVQVGRVCPRCGKEDSVPLIYGLPSPHDQQLAEQGVIALGGCLMPMLGEETAFVCRACGLDWGRQSDPTAHEQALADLLGVPFADVVRALGTGWRREVAADDSEGTQWFVSGEPAQVAVGVTDPWFVLARPLTGWSAERLEQQPADGQHFGRDDLLYLPEVVAEAAEVIAARRRRSFRWCRTCRRVHAPEAFVSGAGICRRCESALADPEA